MAKYSEFINFPIYLYSSKEVEKEVPVDDEPAEEEAEEGTDADKDEDEDSDDVEDAGETRMPVLKLPSPNIRAPLALHNDASTAVQKCLIGLGEVHGCRGTLLHYSKSVLFSRFASVQKTVRRPVITMSLLCALAMKGTSLLFASVVRLPLLALTRCSIIITAVDDVPELAHPIHADEEDEDDEEDAPKTKKVKETVWDWDLLNDNKALWLRSPSDVSEEEYANFYKALAKVPPLLPSPPTLPYSSCLEHQAHARKCVSEAGHMCQTVPLASSQNLFTAH